MERLTDKINADTKVTQTHLNGIKSVFGGIKTWWNRDKKDNVIPEVVQDRPSRRNLFNTIENTRGEEGGYHPALSLRGDDDYSGFYDTDDSYRPPRSTTHQTQQPGSAYDKELDTSIGEC